MRARRGQGQPDFAALEKAMIARASRLADYSLMSTPELTLYFINLNIFQPNILR